MSIVFKTNVTVNKLAKDCINEHLFVNGWELRKALDTLYLFDKKSWNEVDVEPYDISVAYDNNKAIAVMVLTDYSFNTFVKQKYRRKGIGTLLYKEITKMTKRNYTVIPMRRGDKTSLNFFTSLKHKTIDMESLDLLSDISNTILNPNYLLW